jgi:LmbE family N-acetylglucosaminyl deacetylase
MLIWARLRGSRAAVRNYVDLIRFGDRPRCLEHPPSAQRVLVLAPHPDDETLGCGGVLSYYTAAGTAVSVVFISDGGKAGDGAKIRRREAQEASAVLGISDLTFLGLPDGDVSPDKKSVDSVRKLVAGLQPDIVFLPFLMDQHPDHVATNALFLAATSELALSDRIECWGYEIWTPLYANRVVDITGEADRKWEALSRYASQNQELDYLTSTKGLNAFRQRTSYKASGYAEAFFAAPLPEYRELFRRLKSARG